ncbi:glycosyltransferase [Xanthobacteraceae bacterium A53D]
MVGEAARDRKRERLARFGALPSPLSLARAAIARQPRPAPGAHTPPAAPSPLAGTILPVELEALRGAIPADKLAWAHQRARQLRVGGDEVLIAAGLLSPQEATRRAAIHLRLPLDPLTGPLPPADLAPQILRLGTFVTDCAPAPPRFTFAARGLALRRLARQLRADPSLARRARLVSPEHLHKVFARHGADGIGEAAAFHLKTVRPDCSAADIVLSRRVLKRLAVAGAAAAGLAFLAPAAMLLSVEVLLSAVFLANAVIRLAACLMPPPREMPLGLPDAVLPLYSVIVPLYRETAMLPQLVAALQRLDYPPEKLDIKLAIEPDDLAMQEALAGMDLPPWFAVVVAPAIGPRTKPKALNAALPFTRGSYIAVFDAEDVPAPDQLRRALSAFRSTDTSIACVQARLVIENGPESWISRQFAAEYAGHFDVLLPALASLGLPLLLGGTSNHFRRSVLEAVGGWDPYNVTEDADLGIRLARAGWRTAVIASATGEEAPITRRAWIGQRTRWLKGWAQTLLVHGRRPGRLLRDLGPVYTISLALLTAGPFVSALLHPICLAILAFDIAMGTFLCPNSSLLGVAASALSLTNLAVGYVAAGLNCAIGLKRRGRLRQAWILLTLPAYWLLLSWAAWRAIIDLALRPHWWEKTEHGVSKRRGKPAAPSSLLARWFRKPS